MKMIHTQLITTLNNHHKKKTKTDPDGLCQGKKSIGLLSKTMSRLLPSKNIKLSFTKIKKEAMNYLESYLRNSRINSKVLLHDSIIILFKKHIKGVPREMFSI